MKSFRQIGVGVLLCTGIFVMRKYYAHKNYTYQGSETEHSVPILPKMTDELLNVISPYLPENPVIVEAGAFDGNDTLRIAHHWPRGTVHSFEPEPYCFDKLKSVAGTISTVHLYPAALGEKNGEMDFYTSRAANQVPSGSSSLLKPAKHKELYSASFEQTKVPVFSLDAWAKNNKVAKVDFLWLDLQGFELNVLRAAPETLKNVQVVYTEVEFVDLYEKQALYPEVKQWIEQQGFVLVGRDFNLPTDETYGNALFVRKEKLQQTKTA